MDRFTVEVQFVQVEAASADDAVWAVRRWLDTCERSVDQMPGAGYDTLTTCATLEQQVCGAVYELAKRQGGKLVACTRHLGHTENHIDRSYGQAIAWVEPRGEITARSSTWDSLIWTPGAEEAQ